MQIHRNICIAVVEALQQIFENNKQADHYVGKLLKSNPKWGSRDRKFIAESIYEVVRWWRYFVYISGPNPCAVLDFRIWVPGFQFRKRC